MKRSAPMKRGTPLRRVAFKSKTLGSAERGDRPSVVHTPPAAWRAAAPVLDQVRRVEKEHALQHGPYMALVRNLPCARCRRAAPSQFCHTDMGKGGGIKTDCRQGWPGCPECHYLLGSTGKLGREERRRLEALYARQTRAEIRQRGLWPERLPHWPEDEPANDPTFNRDREIAR